MRYFAISHGMRGGYMPDSIHAAKFGTRRELKAHITAEADLIGSAVGLSKAAITQFVANIWRDQGRQYLPFCLAYAQYARQSKGFGIFVSEISRDEFRRMEKEE